MVQRPGAGGGPGGQVAPGTSGRDKHDDKHHSDISRHESASVIVPAPDPSYYASTGRQPKAYRLVN